VICVDQSKPGWYKTWWGILIVIFFILTVFSLIWAGWAKPKWLKIEVSNCIVALLSVGFTYLFLRFLRVKSIVVKLIFGLLWLLFLPNTAYLFTDLGHIPYQWNHTASASGRISLFVQYLLMELFAVLIFLYSCLPFEKIVDRVNVFRKKKVLSLMLFNFLVAYGMVLGRFQHINSWLLFTHPLNVVKSAINIFVSFDLLRLTILFGILCSFVYFLFRSFLLQKIKKYLRIFE
jgi:uncharacterized membrane protein